MSLAKFLFKNPEMMKLHMKRQESIKAVREHLIGKSSHIGKGAEVNAYQAGDKVVKVPFLPEYKHPQPWMQARDIERNRKDIKRRTMLASIGNQKAKNVIPEEFLVATSKGKYTVQPKGVQTSEYKTGGHPSRYLEDERTFISDELGEHGMHVKDLGYHNMAEFGDKVKVIDLGHARYDAPMSTWDRQNALNKFIQKNRKVKDIY